MNVLVSCKNLLLLQSLVNSLSLHFKEYKFYKSFDTQSPNSDFVFEEINLFILDIDTLNLNSLKYLRKKFPDSKVLILSSQIEREYVSICKKFNVSGYFTKRIDIDSLVDAISVITKSSLFICSEWFSLKPQITDDQLNDLLNGVEELSNREIDTLLHSISGLNLDEIAEKMNVEKKSVENYKHRINKKINPSKTSTFSNYLLKHKELLLFLVGRDNKYK